MHLHVIYSYLDTFGILYLYVLNLFGQVIRVNACNVILVTKYRIFWHDFNNLLEFQH